MCYFCTHHCLWQNDVMALWNEKILSSNIEGMYENKQDTVALNTDSMAIQENLRNIAIGNKADDVEIHVVDTKIWFL